MNKVILVSEDGVESQKGEQMKGVTLLRTIKVFSLFLCLIFFTGLGGILLLQDTGHLDQNVLGVSAEKRDASAKEVLAAETQRADLLERIQFDIHARFNQLVTMKKGLDVTGDILLNGDLLAQGHKGDFGIGTLIASNILYGVKPGLGITVSTGQTPTITNTGVLSIGGKTGETVLVAGTGVTIDGLTITNSSPGSSINTFKTITVGGTSFAASSNTDVLTFAAGTGLTVSSDTSAKSVTFASSSVSSQWTTSGTSIYYNGGNVGIGTATPGTALDIVGTLTVSSGITVNGSAGQTVGTAACITSVGGIVTGSAACPVGSAVSPFEASGPVIVETNTTRDLLLGGTATSSAKFGFLNMAGGTPVASISAGSAGAVYLTADGNLQTTNGQQLILGGSTTGNISLSPKNGAGILSLNVGSLRMNDLPGLTSATATCVSFVNGIVTGSADCGPGEGGSVWTQDTNYGTLYPNISTLDLIIGGTSTASAKFAVLNVSGGTPTASVSAGVNGAAYLTAAGNLQTTANQTLTLGGSTTGNLIFSPLNGTGTSSFNGNILFAGTTGFLSTIASAATSAQTWTFPDATGTLCLQASASCGFATGTNYWQLNGSAISPLTQTNTLSVGTTGSLATFDVRALSGTLPVASLSGRTSFATLVVDNSDNGDLFAASSSGLNRFVIKQNGNVGIGKAIPTATLDITGTLTSSGLITGSAGVQAGTWGTTATGITVGTTTTGTGITFQASYTTGKAIFVDAGSLTSGKGININKNTGGDLTAFTGNDLLIDADRSFQGAGAINDTGSSIKVARGNIVNNATGVFTVSGDVVRLSSNCTTTSGGCIDTSSVLSLTQSFTGAQGPVFRIINKAATASALFIGSTEPGVSATAKGFVDIRSSMGTLPIATLSANTSFAGMVVDNNGLGDLFTASKSGATKFTILNNGNLSWAGETNFLSTFASAATSAQTWTLPDATGTICVSGGTCASSGIVGLWQRNSGALTPTNITDDLLLGATSTASAKFAFTNVAGGTPTASISAQNAANNAIYLTADGTLATQSRNTLTIGNSTTYDTTGNVLINPNGTGNLYIGTTAPVGAAKKVYVAGDVKLQNGKKVMFGDTGDLDGFTIGITAATNNAVITQANNASLTINNAGSNSNAILAFQTLSLERMRISNAGLIGINASTPLATLDARAQSATLSVASVSGSTNFAAMVVDNSGSGDIFTASSSGLNRFVIKQGGNVGIGTTLPGNLLSVNSVTAADSLAQLAVGTGLSTNKGIMIQGAVGQSADLMTINDSSGNVLSKIDSLGDGYFGGPNAYVRLGSFGGTDGLIQAYGNNANIPLVFQAKGNQSINFQDPAGNTVFYMNSSDQVILNPGSGNDSTSAFLVRSSANTPILNVDTSNLRVGINTSTPTGGALDIRGSSGTLAVATVSGKTSFAALLVDNSGVGDIFTASSSGATRLTLSSGGTLNLSGDGVYQSGGTSGITVNCASTFALNDITVTGGIVTAGTCSANAADIAEKYDSIESLAFGDVVIADQDNPGMIKRASESYASNVLGIVSTKPYLTLGNIGPGYALALIGRIPTKVTLESGVIKAGDVITSSEIAGFAQKAVKAGSTVGKALESTTNWNANTCPIVASVDAISWPSDDGTNQSHPCFRVVKPDGKTMYIGKIMIFANLSTTFGTGLMLDSNVNTETSAAITQLTGQHSASDSAVLGSQTDTTASSSATEVNGSLHLASLSVDGLATISADLRVQNNALIEGILNVVDTLTTNNLIVSKVANFFGNVIFHGDVDVRGRVTFDDDTVGTVVIKKGKESAEVVYDKQYEKMPHVTVSINSGDSDELDEAILNGQLRYVANKQTTKGFKVTLNKPATEDMTFSWTAFVGKE